MTTDTNEPNTVLADRVALIRGEVQTKNDKATNWQMYGVIAVAVLFFSGFGVYYAKGNTGAEAVNYQPANSLIVDTPDRSPKKLFGDTGPIPRSPAKPSAEVTALQDEIDKLMKALEEQKNGDDMPTAFTTEMKKMRESMTDEMATMQASFDAKVQSYEAYISQLEDRFAAEARLPARPVTLQDSKWVRAQQLNAVDDSGEAARIAAPSMVWDGSQKASGELVEDELTEEMIIEQFGTTFPTSAELTPPPR